MREEKKKSGQEEKNEIYIRRLEVGIQFHAD
jgi:hypothetical protein